MAKVSREILKNFFGPGSKPSSAHYAAMIDSLLHYSDIDPAGLTNYNSSRIYVSGETVIFNKTIFQASRQTSGDFKNEDWVRIGAENSNEAQVFGSEYEIYNSEGASFMTSTSAFASKIGFNTGSRRGLFRIAWQALLLHQNAAGCGKIRLYNVTKNQMLGDELIYDQQSHSAKSLMCAFVLVELEGQEQTVQLQYQTMNDGESFFIEKVMIEIFKIRELN